MMINKSHQDARSSVSFLYLSNVSLLSMKNVETGCIYVIVRCNENQHEIHPCFREARMIETLKDVHEKDNRVTSHPYASISSPDHPFVPPGLL